MQSFLYKFLQQLCPKAYTTYVKMLINIPNIQCFPGEEIQVIKKKSKKILTYYSKYIISFSVVQLPPICIQFTTHWTNSTNFELSSKKKETPATWVDGFLPTRGPEKLITFKDGPTGLLWQRWGRIIDYFIGKNFRWEKFRR